VSAVTVYLDDWRQYARLGPVDDRWSHLIADTDEELHAFAAAMGMRRAWFQDKSGRPHHAHYDLPERARSEAVANGAVEITWRQLGRMLRDRRFAGPDTGGVGERDTGGAAAPTTGGATNPGETG
jgi:hypothetical protein